MAYCTITNIVIHGTPGGKPYTTTSRPTSSEVTDSIIPYIYREINGRLAAAGVTVPVVLADSPNAYAILTDLNALGAAAKALAIGYESKRANGDWIAQLQKQYEARLLEICDNPVSVLQDCAGAESPHKNASRTGDLWDVDDPSDITSHRFYRGQKW